MEDFDLSTTLRQVRRTLPQVAKLPGSIKNVALQAMAEALMEQQDLLLEANTLDLEQMRGQSSPEWLLQGMKLTPDRIQRSAQQLQVLASLPDPIGFIDRSSRKENGLMLNRYRVPLGVIALLYEIYPEFAINGIGMGLKTGNGVVLCSGSEVSYTHQALVDLLSTTAYDAEIPEGAIQSIPSDELQLDSDGIPPLLQQSRLLDLVIPCGRPTWVDRIQHLSSAPTLTTRLGHGHIVLDESASWKQVQVALFGSSASPTDPENSVLPAIQPTPLGLYIHQAWADRCLAALISELTHRGFDLQADPRIRTQYPQLPAISDLMSSGEQPHWQLQIVSNLTEAITLINKSGLRQSEAIISDSQAATQKFIQEVDAATIYVNASPLSSYRNGLPISYSLGLSLGTSIQKLHVRGPIQLEALTTVRYVAQGLIALEEKR